MIYYARPERPRKGMSVWEYDIQGSTVAQIEDFRVFDSKDLTLPLAYRSDTRSPDGRGGIFDNGFYPKLMYGKAYQAVIRLGNMDMDTNYAVSFSRDFTIPIIFPFDPQKPPRDGSTRNTNIYVCALDRWLEIYNLQEVVAPHLEYAKEVASLGVPKEQVLGLIIVRSTFVRRTNSFTFDITRLRKNPNCGKHLAWEYFCREVYDRYNSDPSARTAVPNPGFKHGATMQERGEGRHRVVKTILEHLQGKDTPRATGLNEIRRCEVRELDVSPFKKKPVRRLSRRGSFSHRRQ
jgi:hypothetical protein